METLTTRPGSVMSGNTKLVRHTRFRLIALALTTVSAIVAGAIVWRMRSVDDVPDVGDPFDVDVASRPVFVSDIDNAYVSYCEARRMLTTLPVATPRVDWVKLTWAKAGTNVRAYLEENLQALDVWREGAERPDALYHQPGELALDSTLALVDDLRSLAMLAGLKGSRLEEQGAMADAWSWYKAMLRSSRHVGKRGVLLERVAGAVIHETTAQRIIRWAGDPRVDVALLRRALADSLAADALTPPLSENMKLEYLMCIRDMKELRVTIDEIPMPGGRHGLLERVVTSKPLRGNFQRARLRMTNDVERSRRVLRLLFGNWLAQVDKPATERATIAIPLPVVIYRADPSLTSATGAIAPEKLDATIGNTLFAREYLQPTFWSSHGGSPWAGSGWEGKGTLAREPRRRAVLIVKLAAELYRREQGKPPASASALLGGYLKELPQGIGRDERIPDGID